MFSTWVGASPLTLTVPIAKIGRIRQFFPNSHEFGYQSVRLESLTYARPSKARRMVSRRGLRTAIAIGLLVLVTLLVAFFVVGALAWLLGAMGDEAGRIVLGRIAFAVGVLLAIDLVLLVLAQALGALDDPRQPPEE